MNKYRITAHHVVFFIFVVSNVGGCLTPIGDPPLFLGYLKGVPFGGSPKECWPMWLRRSRLPARNVFYFLDRRNYLRAPKAVREQLAEPADVWRFQGTANLFFLGVILAAVFISDPPFVREFIMVGAAAGSYFTTRKRSTRPTISIFIPSRRWPSSSSGSSPP
jgi:Na+/H+ antiporter NhaD/arsenite permease-like protein